MTFKVLSISMDEAPKFEEELNKYEKEG